MCLTRVGVFTKYHGCNTRSALTSSLLSYGLLSYGLLAGALAMRSGRHDLYLTSVALKLHALRQV
jgi:hypothetical protein